MKLIVGLGNPGKEYLFTRHNAGFFALDYLAKVEGVKWEKEKMGGVWARWGETILLKPQEDYNLSGVVVQKFLQYYKIPVSEMLVVVDDFNLEFGRVRYRERGSAGGDKGLQSIIETLKTEDFARIRIGTGNPEREKMGNVDFVLSKWTAEEREKLPEVFSEVAEKIREW